MVLKLKSFFSRSNSALLCYISAVSSVLAIFVLSSGAIKADSSCIDYGAAKKIGTLDDLDESSGLSASFLNQDVFWTHNDSGSAPTVFAIKSDGTLIAKVSVSGASAFDWEDMAVGPCPSKCACLFISDTGDNYKVRGGGTIYRVPEPIVDGSNSSFSVTLDKAMSFYYPDGSHDAETILVDPKTGIPYVVTKESSGKSSVYKFPSADSETYPVTLIKVADITFPGQTSLSRQATGGSVTGDGSRITVRTYANAWEWELAGSNMDDVWKKIPQRVKIPIRIQGEAISYTSNGHAYILTTETAGLPIDRVACMSLGWQSIPEASLSAQCPFINITKKSSSKNNNSKN